MDEKVRKQVAEAIEHGKKPPENNEEHAARRQERIEFERDATALDKELSDLEAQLERYPYMTQMQYLGVVASIARINVRAARLVLEKKKQV